MDLGTADLLYERRGAVAWLTFNRPQARNAMTFAMYEGIVTVCDAIEADPDIRVLVLTGAGDRAFVAGTDIAQFQAFAEPADAIAYEERMSRVIGRLEAVQRPTIAAIRGYAAGGGAAIALACDLRVCTPDAQIGVPIARTLGNALSMANYARLVDLIGPARTKELIFTARFISASEAHAAGLVNEVVEPERLVERVTQLAEQIAANAPITIQVTKESVRRLLHARRSSLMSAGPDGKEENLALRAYLSDDFREGVRAFLEKRSPQWRGR